MPPQLAKDVVSLPDEGPLPKRLAAMDIFHPLNLLAGKQKDAIYTVAIKGSKASFPRPACLRRR